MRRGRPVGAPMDRLVRIAIAGATSGSVDFAVFNLLLLAMDQGQTTHLLVANSLAFACAMVVNYSMNARLTFRVRMNRRSALAYVLFTCVGLLFYNVNLLWIRELLGADDRLMLNVSKVAAMGLLVIWNYIGYERFVFGPDARRGGGRSA